MLPVQWTYLALGLMLSLVTLVAADPPPGWRDAGFGRPSLFTFPAEEHHLLQVHLAGTATDLATGQAWGLAMDLRGVVVRSTTLGTDGAGGAEEAGDLEARVALLDPGSGAVVEAFTATAAYHASRTDGVARALDAWRFRAFLPEDAGPLWFALAGEATGLRVQEEDLRHAIVASGQARVAAPGSAGEAGDDGGDGDDGAAGDDGDVGADGDAWFSLDAAGHARSERVR